MMKSEVNRRRVRKNFGKIDSVLEMPNLIEIQTNSYNDFLQVGVPASRRQDVGLQAVYKSVFPIHDFAGRGDLEFVSYTLDAPKFDVDECLKRGLTYASPVRATLRLVVWDLDAATGARSMRDIKEQDVYMGDLPLMTRQGTFIINGTERVVVSQMHRSPGVFFDHDNGEEHSSGKFLFAARVIPYRGSWIDFEFDAKDLIHVRIDRRRKLPVSTLLYALDNAETAQARADATQKGKTLDAARAAGMSKEEILAYFYQTITYAKDGKHWKTAFNPDLMRGVKLAFDLVDAETGKVAMEKGQKLVAAKAAQLKKNGLKEYRVAASDFLGHFVAGDIVNMETGEVVMEAGNEITEDDLKQIDSLNLKELSVLNIDYVNVGPYVRNTLVADKNTTREEALIDIYKIMRPGELPVVETADALFQGMFFDLERYDLSPVGRVKMNARLGFDNAQVPDSVRVLRKEDILKILKTLVEIKDGHGAVDDIDNLGNRRVRSVGELMENQYRLGLLRMERAIREKMTSSEIDAVMPYDLVNAKPLATAVREFFASSQLAQFMDQNNPLAEITHKRRMSALGPGGLTRDRAGMEVRDVHPTHYGRICPIESPEGQNIGLINSMASYARINKYGFIETPYRRVADGKVTDEVAYLSAAEEAKHTIAQANAELDKGGRLTQEFVTARRDGDVVTVKASEVDMMDVSPKQVVSVAAALIPFLENDDANRALMGSNMQRQAVPLLKNQAPLVGTGLEGAVARDSLATLTARRAGVVQQVDASRIVIRATSDLSADTSAVDIYTLSKFQRSNQGTCMTQQPLVRTGDKVEKGEIIADGPCTQLGELALGRNVLVAFMPWNGYNYEDSILISERIAREDLFTSIHLEEFEVVARDTKLGQEDITRDIPNAGEEALKQLDETGVIYIGAEVKPGDILVGKVTPKGETVMTPEEKLLRTIFGEKAADVRDSSLRVPPGISGTIVDVRVFTRRGVQKDERALSIEQHEISRLAKDRNDEKKIVQESFYARVRDVLKGEVVTKAEGFKKGTELTADKLAEAGGAELRKINVAKDKAMKQLEQLWNALDAAEKELQAKFENRVEKLQRGDEMLPGELKKVKVYVATKRKLQPGDKMAGRHGNKGVVSRVLPIEDMPYRADGTPVDIVLNPLGVPSRMNVGQILETHLGYACRELGRQIGGIVDAVKAKAAKADDLKDALKKAYGAKEYRKLEDMADRELLAMSDNLRGGLPIATPVFDGANPDDIQKMLEMAGLSASGQVTLYDGLTGEAFERPVTIGYMYMLKLHHLVDEKIHARSIGPYSLVTQQPLGGKAQFGGQRFGEMEVWALEAYGAAYTLQEMLTIKSDDVSGRIKAYETIIRGDNTFEAGIPESFNVLVKEMRSLGLDVELEQNESSFRKGNDHE
ncbi:MAG: DNA-directed RNA polymerase subunit beta [Alphaproteobacteria bacterium]|nr:DNA-directed RNA polymerase subunit beta [Alphaproteobacteria bacterium]